MASKSTTFVVAFVLPLLGAAACADFWGESTSEADRTSTRTGRMSSPSTDRSAQDTYKNAQDADKSGSQDMAMTPVSTSEYVTKAAMSDMFEIQSSRLALQKSSNDQVKSFAQMMVKDHTASSQKLKTALRSKSAGVKAPASLDAEHQSKLQQLNQASAATFDTAYMEMQVSGHRDALNLHRTYASGGDNAALKSFAGEVAPTVQAHFEQAQNLERSLSGSSPMTSTQ